MATTLLRRPRRASGNEHAFLRVPWRGSVEAFVFVVLLCCVCDFLLPVRLGLGLAGIIYGSWSVWLAIRESRSTVLRVNPLVTYQIWQAGTDRKSTRLNSSHLGISYAVFCLKKN